MGDRKKTSSDDSIQLLTLMSKLWRGGNPRLWGGRGPSLVKSPFLPWHLWSAVTDDNIRQRDIIWRKSEISLAYSLGLEYADNTSLWSPLMNRGPHQSYSLKINCSQREDPQLLLGPHWAYSRIRNRTTSSLPQTWPQYTPWYQTHLALPVRKCRQSIILLSFWSTLPLSDLLEANLQSQTTYPNLNSHT